MPRLVLHPLDVVVTTVTLAVWHPHNTTHTRNCIIAILIVLFNLHPLAIPRTSLIPSITLYSRSNPSHSPHRAPRNACILLDGIVDGMGDVGEPSPHLTWEVETNIHQSPT